MKNAIRLVGPLVRLSLPSAVTAGLALASVVLVGVIVSRFDR